MQLKVVTLGAGQDVGRSCVVVSFGGKTFMFDCGMHMGYRDHRRYPDFRLLSHTGSFTDLIDAVLITHFHLDHCGALPYFTEVLGYDGPIYMTSPTRALVPVMLEDYHRVLTERKGQAEVFTRQQIQDCMRKVTVISLHQTLQLGSDCEIKAFYAGHVLGAAMFHVKVGAESVVYTGDYNMTPDRHIGNARVECLKPDLLITESTYATTLRENKRTQERDFISAVQTAVSHGGKVLIPVFAVGRAQELLLLLREHWERTNIQVPIYFSTGMAAKANLYYSLLVNWASQAVQHVALQGKDPFGFSHIQPWQRSLTHAPGPCVLFATPGMLHGGTSLEVFKAWATDPKNLVVLPGYCVSGTVGNKLMCGVTQGLKLGDNETMDVKCQVRYLSFSAHTDLKGILTLLRQCRPQHVMLVHGEKAKMEFLKDKIIRTFGMSCYAPANNSVLRLSTRAAVPIRISPQLLAESLRERAAEAVRDAATAYADISSMKYTTRLSASELDWKAWRSLPPPQPPTAIQIQGALLAYRQTEGAIPALQLVSPSEVPKVIGEELHTLSYSCSVPVRTHAKGTVYHMGYDDSIVAASAVIQMRTQAQGTSCRGNSADDPLNDGRAGRAQAQATAGRGCSDDVNDAGGVNAQRIVDSRLDRGYNEQMDSKRIADRVDNVEVDERGEAVMGGDIGDAEGEDEMLGLLAVARDVLRRLFPADKIEAGSNYLAVRSFHAKLCHVEGAGPTASPTSPATRLQFRCSWTNEDHDLGERCVAALVTLHGQ